MTFLSVLQHTQSEWLGAIEDHLEGRGIRFGYFRPFAAGGRLPELATLGDGLILVGGGAWSAREDSHSLPWLEAGVRLVRACLMTGKPVLALGLGSQILALAADGGIEPAPLRLEVGMAQRTVASALGGLLLESFPNIVYMRDRPLPPVYATTLAVDATGHPAVFQIGANALGFSGHPGLRRAMIEDLVMECAEAPADVGEGLAALGALGSAIDDALVPIMAGLVTAMGWQTASAI